jgi:hypothetical protein
LEAITSLPAKIRVPKQILAVALNMAVAAAAWYFAHQVMVFPALLVVAVAELWPGENQPSWTLIRPRATQLTMGVAAVLMIAILPKAITQVAVAVLYAGWRLAAPRVSYEGRGGLIKLLVVQVAVLEALFLLAAVWQAPLIMVLALLWVACFVTVQQALRERGERAADILAATWALAAVELSWVLVTWLVSYILPGNYLIVPQPVVVLSALAYCFGNIYSAQRQGKLNRARLTEYLLLGLIVLWIIIAGTQWRGTL